jgi:hypothetical protein
LGQYRRIDLVRGMSALPSAPEVLVQAANQRDVPLSILIAVQDLGLTLSATADSITVAKLETAIEVLLGAESSSKSEKRLCEALQAFHGVSENDPIATDPSVTIKQYVKRIVRGPVSFTAHGPSWAKTRKRPAQMPRP